MARSEERTDRRHFGFWITGLVLLALGLTSCTPPTNLYHRRAQKLGFDLVVLSGKPFHHLAYVSADQAPTAALRVYVEHDGSPWLNHTRVAQDPTPRTPFALELMARDAGPRLFLGRPCYFEFRQDPGCTPLLWTHRRYSPEVVDSMIVALQAYREAIGARKLVLVGYSGGGTLAWLMAARIPDVVAVVTVAANLDVELWTSLHGYTPMAGSLNPADSPPLSPSVKQVHYVGGRDRNVPPQVTRSFGAHHASARVVEIPDFDHTCCWVENWPDLLRAAELP